MNLTWPRKCRSIFYPPEFPQHKHVQLAAQAIMAKSVGGDLYYYYTKGPDSPRLHVDWRRFGEIIIGRFIYGDHQPCTQDGHNQPKYAGGCTK